MTPVKPEVAVMHSMDQFALDKLLEGVTPGRHVNNHYNSAYSCHQALIRAGIPCDFITESQLQDNVLNKYKVLYLPYVRIMDSAAAEKIKEFVAAGGAVWADGRCGYLDKHLYLRKCVPGHGLDRVFGCREIDEVAPRPADRLVLKDGSSLPVSREIQRLRADDNAEVLADCNGYPVAVRNHYGKGTTELWGTCLAMNFGADLSGVIPKFAEKNGVNVPVRIKSGKGVIASCRRGNGGILAVFTSLAKESQKITAVFPVTSGKIITPAAASWGNVGLDLKIEPYETTAVLISTSDL